MTTNTHTRRMRRTVRSDMPVKIEARSTVINVQRADHSTSRQATYLDEFEGIIGLGALILPTPYDVPRMFEIIERSNMIKQCVEATVTNTVATGWEVGPVARDIAMDQDEKDELQSFIDFANSEESLSTVMSLAMRNVESVGFGFIEVIRDFKEDISLLRHAPSLYTRLAHKHPDEVLVKYDIRRGKRTVVVKEFRKFRRFVQIIAGRTVWFREFGDPRAMNSMTGLFAHESGYTPDSPATEILHLRNPSNDPYGTPRWMNQLPSVLGSREAEECNMRYFEDNTVPPSMLTVAGGRLTAQSHRDLTRVLSAQGLGKERQNQMILIEAVGEGDSLDGKSNAIQLKVEKLTDQRPSDALFGAYDEANQAKVRSSFRLPSVSVGMANEHNFATANVAMFAAETQVFAPIRNATDEVLNNKIILSRRGLRLSTCKLVARTPAITSPDMLMKSMTALNVMGAVTPRSAQKTANKMLQIEVDEYPQRGEDGYEDWMDKPIIFQTGGKNTHDGQAQKDAGVKSTEEDGSVAQAQPKHGQE